MFRDDNDLVVQGEAVKRPLRPSYIGVHVRAQDG